MYCRLLLAVVFVSFFFTAWSIRCYEGYGNECMLGDDTKLCDGNQKCQCIKFRYKCSKVDFGCTPKERDTGALRWGMMIGGNTSCEIMKKPSEEYHTVSCCSEEKCNKPADGPCSNL